MKGQFPFENSIKQLVLHLDSLISNVEHFSSEGSEQVSQNINNNKKINHILSCQIVNFGSEAGKLNNYDVYNYCHTIDTYEQELEKHFKNAEKNKSILSIEKDVNDDGIWYSKRVPKQTAVTDINLEYRQRTTVASYEVYSGEAESKEQWNNWRDLMFSIYENANSVLSKNIRIKLTEKKHLYSGIYITFSCKLNFKQIGIIGRICETLLNEIAFQDLIPNLHQGIERQATKSAISQVMARNSSHNIGSHVLNKLTGDLSSINIGDFKNYISNFTNKVFTNSDKDRLDQISKFNNYIKCRMDYLSDITFGIPAMQISKRLNSEILSDIDDVRLLLENISGLSNFEYSIKIENESDPTIAMPNDILGSQAFYNIIENIIRNTAKHSDKKTLNSKKKTNPVIEFTILISEITDKSLDEGNIFYQVDVYDNVVITKKKNFKNDRDAKDAYIKNLKFNTNEEKKEALNNLTNLEYLVYSQNNKLNDSILKDDNTLRSTSLGLIEMEASACYLRKMDISNLESDDYQIDYNSEIKNSKGNLNILKAVAIDNKHLGYRFFVLKPTEVLLVGNYELSADLKNNGFLSLTFEDFQKEIEKGTVFNHQFLVYEIEKVFELINLLEEVKGLNNTIIEVAKYKTLLPKRIMKLSKTEIEFNERQPNEVLQLLWEKWAKHEGFKNFSITTSIPKAECKGNQFTLLNHSKSGMEIEEFTRFKFYLDNPSCNYYLEALSSQGQSKLPNFNKLSSGEFDKNDKSLSNYLTNINHSNMEYLQIQESCSTLICLIDERIQAAAFSLKYENELEYFKLYAKTNIYIPTESEVNLSSNDFTNLVSLKLFRYIIQIAKKVNYIIIHYSLLERVYRSKSNKLDYINSFLNKLSQKTNIVVTSGRGIPPELPTSVCFASLSSIIAASIDYRSKHYLSQIVFNSRKSSKI